MNESDDTDVDFNVTDFVQQSLNHWNNAKNTTTRHYARRNYYFQRYTRHGYQHHNNYIYTGTSEYINNSLNLHEKPRKS